MIANDAVRVERPERAWVVAWGHFRLGRVGDMEVILIRMGMVRGPDHR